MFSFLLITTILFFIYFQTTKPSDGVEFKGNDNRIDYKNLDKVAFLIAKKNGGIITTPAFCIESGLSAIDATNYLAKMERENFIFSSYSKKMSQIIYYVNEYLTEENRKDLDLFD